MSSGLRGGGGGLLICRIRKSSAKFCPLFFVQLLVKICTSKKVLHFLVRKHEKILSPSVDMIYVFAKLCSFKKPKENSGAIDEKSAKGAVFWLAGI